MSEKSYLLIEAGLLSSIAIGVGRQAIAIAAGQHDLACPVKASGDGIESIG